MGNFKRNNGSDRRRGGGGFSGRSSGRPEMHKVVCSECGRDCEVPFKPSMDKPVFCSDCFKGGANTDQRKSSRDSRGFGSGDKRMHEAICDECGKRCQVPFKPTSGKPIYCSECFGKVDKGDNEDRGSRRSRESRGDRDKSFDQTSKQLEAVNDKLNKILEVLSSIIPIEARESKKPIQETKIVKSKKINKDNDKSKDKIKDKKKASSKKVKTKPKKKK